MSSTTHRRSVSFTGSIKLNRDSKDNSEPKSENSSPRVSKDTTPRSKDTTPRSKESTPRSRENSPRKTLLKVVHKITHKDETPPHKHSSIYPLYDEQGRELGEYHYELFEAAIIGNLRSVKEIMDTGRFTHADKQICADAARKHNYPDIAYFIDTYNV